MKRVNRYTKEQIDYVRSIAEGRYNDEITEMFNEKFNLNVRVVQINSMKANHGIKSNVPRHKPGSQKRLFTKEQELFVRENAKGISTQELVDRVNDKYGTKFTEQQMITWKTNHGVSSGLTGWFEEGQEPWNKGMKGLQIGGEETQFQPGQRPVNYLDVGTETVDGEGYARIKVSDHGNYQKRFKLKHHLVWEDANGPIPEDKVLLFADGDKTNITLENLMLVTRQQLVRLNQNGLISNDRELTESGIIIADILNKRGELERG